MIVLKHNFTNFDKNVTDPIARQIPFATSRAINTFMKREKVEQGKDLQKATEKDLKPYSMRQAFIKFADKKDLSSVMFWGTSQKKELNANDNKLYMANIIKKKTVKPNKGKRKLSLLNTKETKNPIVNNRGQVMRNIYDKIPQKVIKGSRGRYSRLMFKEIGGLYGIWQLKTKRQDFGKLADGRDKRFKLLLSMGKRKRLTTPTYKPNLSVIPRYKRDMPRLMNYHIQRVLKQEIKRIKGNMMNFK